jgi:hypothetical protein
MIMILVSAAVGAGVGGVLEQAGLDVVPLAIIAGFGATIVAVIVRNELINRLSGAGPDDFRIPMVVIVYGRRSRGSLAGGDSTTWRGAFRGVGRYRGRPRLVDPHVDADDHLLHEPAAQSLNLLAAVLRGGSCADGPRGTQPLPSETLRGPVGDESLRPCVASWTRAAWQPFSDAAGDGLLAVASRQRDST